MIFNLIIGLALMIIGYLIQPKQKQPQPSETTEDDLPKADANTPWPVLFGRMQIKTGYFLWYGDKKRVKKKTKTTKK